MSGKEIDRLFECAGSGKGARPSARVTRFEGEKVEIVLRGFDGPHGVVRARQLLVLLDHAEHFAHYAEVRGRKEGP